MNLKILAVSLLALIAAAAALAVRPLSDSADSPSDEASKTSDSADPAPVKLLPAPKGVTVLRVTGVSRGNAGAHTTKVDFATLDDLGREQVTVYEPFLKHDVKFTGLRMSELLSAVRLPESASRVYMHALDDYHVNLAQAALASGGFVATRADGKRIPVAEGGPIRLVFTGEGDMAANSDNWIWSLDSIRPGG